MDLFVFTKALFFLGLVLTLAYGCFILAKKKLSIKIDNKNQRIKISNYARIDQKTFLCLIHTDKKEYLFISNGTALSLEQINNESKE